MCLFRHEILQPFMNLIPDSLECRQSHVLVAVHGGGIIKPPMQPFRTTGK
jgi:hypothetical protein